MPSILIFFAILSFLVIIHELGHFWAAKKVGVKVLEFGLGLPPKLFGKKFRGTLYSFNLLPFGGFVRLKGEDEIHSNEATNSSSTESDNFSDKNPYQRAFVVVAGVVMNFVLAVILFQLIMYFGGFKSSYLPLFFDFQPVAGNLEVVPTVITSVSVESKLDMDTFSPGDYIYSVDGIQITSFDSLRGIVNSSVDDKVTLVVKNLRDISFIREMEVDLITKEGSKFIGVSLNKAGRIDYQNGLEPLSGLLHSFNMTSFTFNSMGFLVSKAFELNSPEIVTENVSGPVGIYNVVDIIVSETQSVFSLELMNLVALLSLSLAIMNLLPIPAVDGGRLVFIVFEMVTKRKPNPKIELAVNKYGMLVLLGLLIAVTYKDISQLIGN